jgi:hypothetical protein
LHHLNNSGEDTIKVVFEGYEIQLKILAPYPEHEFASKEIAPGDYEATFVVTMATSKPAPTTP